MTPNKGNLCNIDNINRIMIFQKILEGESFAVFLKAESSPFRKRQKPPKASQVVKNGSLVKNLPPNARDVGLIPGLGRHPGEENGNPFQCSCLENPMDGGAWRATVQGGHRELDTTERLTHTVD